MKIEYENTNPRFYGHSIGSLEYQVVYDYLTGKISNRQMLLALNKPVSGSNQGIITKVVRQWVQDGTITFNREDF